MIKIIDYKAGNAPSVLHALKHLGHKAELASGVMDLSNATHIILPGVGSAKATMESLKEMNLIPKLEKMIMTRKLPFLGICVGMHVLFEYSEEENAACLAWLKGRVIKYDSQNVRVPQMGWNQVNFKKNTPLAKTPDGYFYFVNSYHVEPDDEDEVWATADYDGKFVAAIQCENIYATQFHIEKSGKEGLALLNSFVSQSSPSV